jgi:hypothetical protein
MTACRSANRSSDVSAMLVTACPSLSSSSSIVLADNTSSNFPLLGAMCDPVHALKEAAMEYQFFIRQQNLKLYRSLVAASEAAAAKADARQKKQLKLLAKEVASEPPPIKN